MSTNRILYFIRNNLQNSKLNIYKFVKSKKIYNETIIKNKKNYNLNLQRKFSTNSFRYPPPNNNNNGPNWVFILMVSFASYFVSRK